MTIAGELAEKGVADNPGNMARLRLWTEQRVGLHIFLPLFR